MSSLQELLTSTGQGHLWDHLQTLKDPADRAALERSIRHCGCDLALYRSIFAESMRVLEHGPGGEIRPPKAEELIDVAAVPADVVEAGRQATARGEMAVLILAGGSGTRLGQSYPKGMLECKTLGTKKSLFQLQCERVRRLQELIPGCRPIPLMYMTSEQNDKDTREYFKKHNYFGLQADQVHFFVQSSMPCCSPEGKILLASPTEVATAPGGNAGLYGSLLKSGTLDAIAAKGVKYVQIFTVDNILCKLGDPAWTGYAATKKCDIVVKACPKAHDHEAVGVFVRRDGKLAVVEYTEIGKERAEAKDPKTGKRLFDAAHIAINLLSVDYLRLVGQKMESYTYYHIAKKSIPTMNGKVPGIKLEAFIFDLFEFAERFAILSVNRDEEFSPIKNADDESHTAKDSPYTAVKALHALHFRWVVEAAKKFVEEKKLTKEQCAVLLAPDAASHPIPVEISPLVSYGGEGITPEQVLQVCQHKGKDETLVLQSSSRL